LCCICSHAKENKDKVGFQRCQMHIHWLLWKKLGVQIVQSQSQYVIVNHDFIFDESKKINEETMLLRFDCKYE
jgi:hypothetical protein